MSEEIIKVDYDTYYTSTTKKYKERKSYQAPNKKVELVMLPGIIIDVLVKPGDEIKPGTPIYVLDAMKMHNIFNANFGGVVKIVNAKVGDRVVKKFPILEYK